MVNTGGGQEPIPLARDGVHEKVLTRLDQMSRGTVLDVPTGYGALAKSLSQMGFDVSCCDIDPSVFTLEGLKVDQGDLNDHIPYDDGVFDYVCFLEAIEHTENPYCAVREVARVLKPGGILFLSTPNYLSIERRLKFLATGYFTKPVSQKRFLERHGGKPYGMHLSPIGYTIIRFALENAGLKIVEMTYDRKKPKQAFLKPLALLIRLYARLWSKEKRCEYWLSETNSHTLLEGGNTLIIIAQKTDS